MQHIQKRDCRPLSPISKSRRAHPHAFQVSFALDYVDADCFTRSTPTIVPAKTFLSQLV